MIHLSSQKGGHYNFLIKLIIYGSDISYYGCRNWKQIWWC
jgi:hypothetical protein